MFLACSSDDDVATGSSSNGSVDQSTTDNGLTPGDVFSSTKLLTYQDAPSSLAVGQTFTFSCITIGLGGEASIDNSDISWTSSNANVVSVNSGVLTGKSAGESVVTGELTENGLITKFMVPVTVKGNKEEEALFTVMPWTIISEVRDPSEQLNVTFLGEGVDFKYSSSDPSIASVSSSGEVNFLKAGTCVISIKGEGLPSGRDLTKVPVVVRDVVAIELPVTKVTLNTSAQNLFKNESVTLTPKALKGDGSVNEDVTFSWKVVSGDTAISVSANGEVTAKDLGGGVVSVSAEGVSAQAQITVLPKKVLVVAPIHLNLKPGESQELTTKLYKVDKTTGSIVLPAEDNNPSVSYTSAFSLVGMKMVEVSTTGLVKAKDMAVGSDFIVVTSNTTQDPSEILPGFSSVMIMPGGLDMDNPDLGGLGDLENLGNLGGLPLQ